MAVSIAIRIGGVLVVASLGSKMERCQSEVIASYCFTHGNKFGAMEAM